MRGRFLGLITLIALGGALLAPAAGRAAIAGLEYIEVSDGTLIAVNVQFPSDTPPPGGWPILIQMDGYGGASSPMNPNSLTFGAGNYATVHMSLRGTGCSGGKFDLFDRRSSLDGYEVIENLAHRSWANGKVAIWGHSYSGLTGWLVGATQPPSLAAMSVSGLIADLYRGIVYMGGVSNFGFPLLWTGIYRPASEYGSGVVPGVTSGDPTCTANQATRYPPDVMDNPILNGVMALGEDGQWWASHSTITYLDGINVPIHIVQSYQDEQTGPRGSNLLWQRLDERKPDLPKRLLLTNGVHSTNTAPPAIRDDRIAWLDCYVRDTCSADILDQAARVKVFWEMHHDGSALVANAVTADPDWPLEATEWTRYFLAPDGGLGTAPPAEGTAAYLAGSKRAGAWSYLAGSNLGSEVTTADLPDEARFTTDPFATDTAIAGPIAMRLYAASSAPDTEFYVELNDVDPAGNVTRLQRGLLKASHRAVDLLRTDFNADGEIIRPHHPHTNTTTSLLVPGEVTAFDIEIFPLGHVFRAGHSLLVRVSAPPANDSIATYLPTTPPAVNTLFMGGLTASSILLPVIPGVEVAGPDLGCGKQVGLERCSKPVL